MTRTRRLAGALSAFALIAAGLVLAQPAGALSTADRIDNAVLALMNQERAAHHLSPLHGSAALRRSASLHNQTMARANALSHQLPGEAVFSTRITRAGYHWSSAAENIGYNSDMTLAGALVLQRLMYNEKAPNDGHRRNILSAQSVNVGVQVYLDTRHHKIWLTEDFARPLS